MLLDVHFPIAIYRKILGLPLGLEDLPDEGLRKGLKQLLDYDGDDVEDVFCLSFEIMWMELGEERRLELKENGSNTPVTSQNKEEYVLRYTRWILVDSIDKQWQRFQAGFMRVVEDSSLDLFLPGRSSAMPHLSKWSTFTPRLCSGAGAAGCWVARVGFQGTRTQR